MRDRFCQDAEHRGRLSPGSVCLGIAAAALVCLLLGATGRLYTLRQENQALEQALDARQTELAKLEQEASMMPDLRTRAEALGLVMPDPADTVILHLRRENPGRKTYGTFCGIE